MGHFAAVCWSKSVSASNDSSAGRWLLGVLSSDLHQDDKWKVQLKVSGKPVVFKIDTGADIAAISKSTLDSLPNQPKLHASKIAFSVQEASSSALGSLQQQ